MATPLDLFPARIAFTEPGTGRLTPEGYRALTALFRRVGGANAPGNDELAMFRMPVFPVFPVFLDDGHDSESLMPGPPGQAGAKGGDGFPLFLLQESPEASDWIPPGTLPDETFIAPTLLNSWVAFGGTGNPPGYFKDAHGVVHLRGLVKSGTVGAAIFTLPAGYRPANQELFACVSNDAFGRLDVTSAGNVTLAVGSNVFASLDGVIFRAAGTY